MGCERGEVQKHFFATHSTDRHSVCQDLPVSLSLTLWKGLWGLPSFPPLPLPLSLLEVPPTSICRNCLLLLCTRAWLCILETHHIIHTPTHPPRQAGRQVGRQRSGRSRTRTSRGVEGAGRKQAGWLDTLNHHNHHHTLTQAHWVGVGGCQPGWMNEWKYWDGWKRPHTDWGSFSVDKVKCKSLSWGRGSSKPCCTVCVCVGHGLVSSILSCGPILHTVTVCILFSLSLLLCFMWGGGGGGCQEKWMRFCLPTCLGEWARTPCRAGRC